MYPFVQIYRQLQGDHSKPRHLKLPEMGEEYLKLQKYSITVSQEK